MAIFKIISSRRSDKQDTAEFGVSPIGGELVVGDEFCCYDTHHPVDYRIQAIQSSADGLVLICSGFLGFDEQFVGAIIDTTKRGKPYGFRYDVA